MVVAHTNDHAGLLEAQIDWATTPTLTIAHATHYVVGFFRDCFDRANVVGVVDGEAAVVKYPSRHGQGQALGQLNNLALGMGVANVDATDQQGIFGVQ
jgi:hypothetical protein